MSRSNTLLSLLTKALSEDTASPEQNLPASDDNVMDTDDLHKGALITIDFIKDFNRVFKVVGIHDDKVTVVDLKTKKRYRVPLEKIAVYDVQSPYTKDELDTRYSVGHSDDGIEGDLNYGTDDEGKPCLKSVSKMLKLNPEKVKNKGVKLTVLQNTISQAEKSRMPTEYGASKS